MKKYELTNDTITHNGRTLYRIKALRDIPRYNVKAGDMGGYIEKEANLSHNDDCWVGDNAMVFGYAKVCGSAWVFGNAEVYDTAWVSGNAWVFGIAEVFGYARVYGNAIVSGDTKVYGDAIVCGNARVYGNARVCGNTHLDSGIRNGESTTDTEPEAKTKDSNEIVLANIVLSSGKLGLRSGQKDIDTKALLKQLLT